MALRHRRTQICEVKYTEKMKHGLSRVKSTSQLKFDEESWKLRRCEKMLGMKNSEVGEGKNGMLKLWRL